MNSPTLESLLAENARLHTRLEEVEHASCAVRTIGNDGPFQENPAGAEACPQRRSSSEANHFRCEILDQINDAVIAVGTGQRVTYINAAAGQLYGITASEALGRRQGEIYETRWTSDEVAMAADEALHQSGHWRGECIHIKPDGTQIPVEVSITCQHDESRDCSGFLAVIRDITQRKQAEADLRESREDLKSAQEVAQIGSWRLNIRQNLLTWSDEAHRIFGVAKGLPLTYETFLAIIHPDDRAAVDASWQAALRGETYHIEHRIVVGGEVKWVLERAYLEFDDAGVLLGGFGITQDITQRKRSEEALRESDHRMRLATEATGVGIWEWHVPSGRIRWDAQMFRIYGITPTEDGYVDYSDWSGAVVPEELQQQEAILQDTYRKLGNSRREFRIRRRDDGEYRHIQACEAVRDNGQGQIEWVVGTNLDITAQKQAEEALRISGQYARSQWAETEAALEAIPANIAILDSDGFIMRVNTAWKSFCCENGGTSEAVSAGVNYLTVCDSASGPETDDARRFAAGIRSVIHGESERFSMEYPCHSPTEQRWFMGYVTAARGGGPARAVIAHVDITEQKRIEDQIRTLNYELESRVIARTAKLRAAIEALQAEIDKRRLLEREILEISEREQSRFGQDLHDGLGQELAGIALISKVLAEKLEAESHPLAASASNITSYISDSIQSTRRLAKGLYPIELDRFGLLLALEDLANQTSLRFGIRCELKQTGDAPKLDDSAQIHIYRIVQESIGNAIKHGKAGHIVIESAAGDGCHTFTITDDGRGFQKPAGKCGMGLHLMKYRARVIGAEISVERPDQGGCRIICRLPLAGSSM